MRGGLKSECESIFKYLAIILLTLTVPVTTFAQSSSDPPIDGCDPYDGCAVPLDTWVMLLVVIAVCYGIYHLHKKQKTVSA